MPVYEPKDYGHVIARIQKKVIEKNIKMGECLSEAQIKAFEKNCNIELPKAYRMFLMSVGDGCGCPEFPLNRLESIEQRDLSRPFMPEEFWVWEDEKRDGGDIYKEIQAEVYQGEIELINLGCGSCFHLIVTGKCRGEVWHFTDISVQPCCERQDFLGWFELWLDEQEQADYFKDYVYE